MEREPRRFQGWHREEVVPVISTEGQLVEELQPFEPPQDFTDLTGKVWRLGGASYDRRNPEARFYQYFIPMHPTVDNPRPSGLEFKTFSEGYIKDVIRELAKEAEKERRLNGS